MIKADNFSNDVKTLIDGKWVVCRSLPFYGFYGFMLRVKDAFAVLIGKADAIEFYKQ